MNDLDHPCKQTCSGWKQGYEKGIQEMRAQLAESKRELAIVNRIIEGLKHYEPVPDTSPSIETIIDQWHRYWMSQSGYSSRALSVDANMRHDLERRLAQTEKVDAPFIECAEPNRKGLGHLWIDGKCAGCGAKQSGTDSSNG